jgi:hypothetical protein
MAVNAISQANGADALEKLQQKAGQSQSTTPSQNTVATLKTAAAEAQLSEASIVGGGQPDNSGNLLNTYG